MSKFTLSALCAGLLLGAGGLWAQDAVEQELAGLGDVNQGSETNPDPQARINALEGLASGGLLLIPEGTAGFQSRASVRVQLLR